MPEQQLSPSARPASLLAQMYTRQQLAKELGFTCDTLCRWEARQIGPPCTRIGRRVLYRRDAVEAWLLSGGKAVLAMTKMISLLRRSQRFARG